jgi:hypothetical protein
LPIRISPRSEVGDLFITVNRLLSPPDLRDAFEAYINRSLEEEIDRIPAYYGERDGGFWVAVRADTVIGTFGLERTSANSFELRRMYILILRREGGGLADRCSGGPRMNAAPGTHPGLSSARLKYRALRSKRKPYSVEPRVAGGEISTYRIIETRTLRSSVCETRTSSRRTRGTTAV